MYLGAHSENIICLTQTMASLEGERERDRCKKVSKFKTLKVIPTRTWVDGLKNSLKKPLSRCLYLLFPQPDKDIRISGQTTFVGKTSLEISVWLEQLSDGAWERITKAVFVMVARNSNNTASAFVNKIEPGDEREKQIFNSGLGKFAGHVVCIFTIASCHLR
jgi:Acyl-CoA hydrolase